MRLLIATPTWGMNVTVPYVHGLIDAITTLANAGIETNVVMSPIDLISRARNKCAKAALEIKADKMLFVDSDLSWKGEHVLKLLKSDKPIIGGTYPLKAYPLRLNLHALDDKMKGMNVHEFLQTADNRGEIEVNKIPIGFMMIDMSVYRKMSLTAPWYKDGNGITGEIERMQDFHHIAIHGEDYDTEDWGFIRAVKAAGYKIYFHSEVILDHTGVHTFSCKKEVDIESNKIDISP